MEKRPKFRHQNRLLLLAFSPFPISIVVTILAVLVVGEYFPRQIAPDSGVKLAGAVASVTVFVIVTRSIVRLGLDEAPRRFGIILALVTSLMAWPVWTLGIMPSLNGLSFGKEVTTPMRLVGLSISRPKKSRQIYYVARLEPFSDAAPIGQGRYYVPQAVYLEWERRGQGRVEVGHSRGLLGAEIALSFR